jgi:membrane protein
MDGRLRHLSDRSRLARLVLGAAADYGLNRCPQFAASIAYHVLLSLFPLALLVATLGGLLLRDDERRTDVANAIADRVPLLAEAGVDLDAALSTSLQSLGLLGLIGTVSLLWSASGMMSSLRIGVNAAWGAVRAQPFVRGKLLDLAVVVAVNCFLVLSIWLVLLQPLFLPSWSSWLTSILGSVVGWFAATAALYRVVPVVRPGPRTVVGAAGLAAAGLTLLQHGFSLYTERFADFSAVYGSLATVVAFLVFVYLAASVILFCASLAAAWERAEQPPVR